ncbi:MAG: TonB-dependent receptor plug domain-containing protein, partial [Deltaproteobacteria bacterium]|nr:TonB-dependent receptor plug domain-containing protein [Deltaproteobacteria bacterium]
MPPYRTLRLLCLPLVLSAPGALAAEPNAPVASPQPAPSVRLPTVEVLGDSEEALQAVPGSAAKLEAEALEQAHLLTTNEALRKVPGVVAVDEEGLGLRPNIGLRGLDPNRSRKVLLLEDGVPLSMAPYGDNASYYHPPIERFERIEVLKGGGQLLYGPSSIGGVINYLTPMPASRPSARVTLSAGNRNYVNVNGQAGGVVGDNGLIGSFMHKRGMGARDNTFSELTDVTFKALVGLGTRQWLTLKASYYQEDSRLTYSGLTEAEFAANPRQNPFRHDTFNGKRFGLSAQHEFIFTDTLALRTTAYAGLFKRDWWRQSSNSGQRPNDSADLACGGMANLDTTCGNQGRLREYTMGGV